MFTTLLFLLVTFFVMYLVTLLKLVTLMCYVAFTGKQLAS